MDSVYQKIKQFGKVRKAESMSKHAQIRAGGKVKHFISVDTKEDMTDLLQVLDSMGLEHFVFKQGRNVLVGNGGFDGVAVKYQANKVLSDDPIVAEAGINITELAQVSMEKNYQGFEFGVGFVGSIAEALDDDVSVLANNVRDVVGIVEVYRSGEVLNIKPSGLEGKDIILQVELSLEKRKNKDQGKKSIKYLNYKNNNIPRFKSYLGPVFKNLPEDISWENSQLSFKDNFIVKEGKTTSLEILKAIETIEQKVYDEYTIDLKRRTKLVGDFTH